MMDRRRFIVDSGVKLGILTIGSGFLFPSGCTSPESAAFNASFTSDEVKLINELGNVIIPPTGIPGAKDAQVGEFIALMVHDCYPPEEKVKFKNYLADVNTFSRQNYKHSFMDCIEAERIELVSKMEMNHEGYKLIKTLIVSAYLSSEIGMTQLFDYYPVPGRYDGCTPNKPW